MKNRNNKTRRGVGSPRRLTPQQQLWELTDEFQQLIFKQVFRHLRKEDVEDLCYAMIAYLRFKIRRPFECPFMQVLYLSFIDLVDDKSFAEMMQGNKYVKPQKSKQNEDK